MDILLGILAYSAIHRIWLQYSLRNVSRAGYNILPVYLSQFYISIPLKPEKVLDKEIITGRAGLLFS